MHSPSDRVHAYVYRAHTRAYYVVVGTRKYVRVAHYVDGAVGDLYPPGAPPEGK